MFTCYKDRSLQSNLGASETAAHTLVGARVPRFDLRDVQAAVGQQNHAVKEENDKRFMLLD